MRYLFLLLASGFVLAGCSHNPNLVDIHGKDSAVFVPEGEVEVRLGGSKSVSHAPYLAVSAGYARGEGRFNQTLSSEQFVNVDGTEIYGPETLYNKASLEVAYLRGKIHSSPLQGFDIFMGGGLAILELDFATMTESRRSTASEEQFSLHGLLGLGYRFNPMFGIEGSAALYITPISLFDNATLIEEKVLLTASPTEQVRVFAGYRRWFYEIIRDNLLDYSPLGFDFSGPTAGVTLRF